MKDRLLIIGVMTTAAVVLHALFEVPLGWTMVVLLVVLPMAGLLITADDELAGGWNNPDGKAIPPWRHGEFWGDLLLRISIAVGGFAIDSGWNTKEGAIFWACAIIGVTASVGIMKRWPYRA